LVYVNGVELLWVLETNATQQAFSHQVRLAIYWSQNSIWHG